MAITEKAKIMLLNKGILVGKKNDDWKKNNAIINLALNIRVEEGEELLTEENVFEVERLFGCGQVTEPFYRGFPASVKRIGLEEKLIDQILHYWGIVDSSIFETEEDTIRTVFTEHCSKKVFEVVTEEDAEKRILTIFKDYANSTREWSANVEEFMIEQMIEMDLPLYQVVGAKNAITSQYKLYSAGKENKISYKLKDIIKLIDNYQSYQIKETLIPGGVKRDWSLRLKIPSKDRKILTKMIKNCDINCMDLIPCFEKREDWKHLLHALHCYDKRLQPLYGKNMSKSSAFENLMAKGKIIEAAKTLEPNEIIRKLKYLVSRLDENNKDEFYYEINRRLRRINGSVIPAIQLYLDENSNNARTFSFNHNKIQITHKETAEEVKRRRTVLRPDQKEDVDKVLLNVMKNHIYNKIWSKKIYVDPDMDKIALPINLTTSQAGFNTLPSGSIVDLPKTKVFRLFVYWEKVNDIDLAMIGFNKDGSMEEFSWRNMSRKDGSSILFSGDETRGYDGGSEYFDVDIERVKKEYPNLTHLVCCANVFSGVNFSQIVAKGGYMTRDKVGSGEVYEPKTVKSNLDLTAETLGVVMYALDIYNNKLIWLNVGLKSGRIAGEQDLSQFKKYLNLTQKLSVKKYFDLCPGHQTDEPDSADIIISDHKFDLKDDQIQIKSKDYEQLIKFID